MDSKNVFILNRSPSLLRCGSAATCWRTAVAVLGAALLAGCATSASHQKNPGTQESTAAVSKTAQIPPAGPDSAPPFATLSKDGHVFVWMDGDLGNALSVPYDAAAAAWRAGSCAYPLKNWGTGVLTEISAPTYDRLRSADRVSNSFVVLTSSFDRDTLFAHLSKLRHLTTTDGQSQCMQFAARDMELYSSAFSGDRWNQMLGPIRQVVWFIGDDAARREWRSSTNPKPQAETLASDGAFQLTEQEVKAADAAAMGAFLQIAAHDLRLAHPESLGQGDQAFMARLRSYAQLADDLGVSQESHVRWYLNMRLSYPDEAFAEGQPVMKVLSRTEQEPRQRLAEASDLLQRQYGKPVLNK